MARQKELLVVDQASSGLGCRARTQRTVGLLDALRSSSKYSIICPQDTDSHPMTFSNFQFRPTPSWYSRSNFCPSRICRSLLKTSRLRSRRGSMDVTPVLNYLAGCGKTLVRVPGSGGKRQLCPTNDVKRHRRCKRRASLLRFRSHPPDAYPSQASCTGASYQASSCLRNDRSLL